MRNPTVCRSSSDSPATELRRCPELSQPSGINSVVPFAFVAAVGGVGFKDVAVSGIQLFQYTTLVHHSGAAVIGETV